MGSDSSADYHKFNQALIQKAALVSDVVSILEKINTYLDTSYAAINFTTIVPFKTYL